MHSHLSWIAQLVRALARKAKGPGSSPSAEQTFSLKFLQLATDGFDLKIKFSLLIFFLRLCSENKIYEIDRAYISLTLSLSLSLCVCV